MVSRVVAGNIVFGRCSFTATAGTRVGFHIPFPTNWPSHSIPPQISSSGESANPRREISKARLCFHATGECEKQGWTKYGLVSAPYPCHLALKKKPNAPRVWIAVILAALAALVLRTVACPLRCLQFEGSLRCCVLRDPDEVFLLSKKGIQCTNISWPLPCCRSQVERSPNSSAKAHLRNKKPVRATSSVTVVKSSIKVISPF